MRRNRVLCDQSGNVFIIILVGIALFAALSVVVSRSMRTESASKMTEREAALVASEILDYGQVLARAVDRVRRKGCSENDISFANDIVSGYEHTPVVADKCKVFHPDGGGARWQDPPVSSFPYKIWGSDAVQGLGSDPASELILALQLPSNQFRALCEVYNAKLGLGTTIAVGTGDEEDDVFVGTYGDAALSINETPDQQVACFQEDAVGSYIFYYALHVR